MVRVVLDESITIFATSNNNFYHYEHYFIKR